MGLSSFTDGSRYAETWDMEVGPMTFIQFDLVMSCTDTHTSQYNVSVQYSTDRGKHWTNVRNTIYLYILN